MNKEAKTLRAMIEWVDRRIAEFGEGSKYYQRMKEDLENDLIRNLT